MTTTRPYTYPYPADTLSARDVPLGSFRDEFGGHYAVSVDVRLEPMTGPHETIEHETVTGGWRLGISALVYVATKSGARDRRYADCIGAGQCRDDVASIRKPAAPFTADDVARLVAIWDEWHLNDMRAACAHMSLPRDTSYDAQRGITCPRVSLVKDRHAYRYGAAWLYAPLPDDVVSFVREFIRKAHAAS